MLNLGFLGKWLQVFIVGWIVSFYLFPTAFVFAPTFNSKMLLACIGIPLLSMHILRSRDYSLGSGILGVLVISLTYSLINLISVDYNGSSDYSYANYITTALVWLFGAYTVNQSIAYVHGKTNFKLLTFYLAAVCALQCLVALAIDYIPGVLESINIIFHQPVDFFDEANRLFGIGAALDPAGTRFAIVLIMISILLTSDAEVQKSSSNITWLLISFFVISSIGNIMSRTTTTGLAVALLVLFFGVQTREVFTVKKDFFRLYGIFSLVLLVLVPLVVYYYNTDEYFYDQIRYGFEGFFSLVEKGYWQTDSNDILATMWRWPKTEAGWIIGYGKFDNFLYETDIGYCRLILYSGVLGITVFTLLFIYSAWYFFLRYPKFRFFWFLLLCMTFIIWVKVSTDLFQFWALFYTFVDYDELAPKFKPVEQSEERTIPLLAS